MSTNVWLLAHTIHYAAGGGHFWAYLNWALGLRDLGIQLTWLETLDPLDAKKENHELIENLRKRLEPYGLAQSMAFCSESEKNHFTKEQTAALHKAGFKTIEHAPEAELLINFRYGTPEHVIRSFKRSALIDIDPGLLQIWVSRGEVRITPHDLYFTIGLNVGTPGSKIPSLGLDWIPTRPAVHIPSWPVVAQPTEKDNAAFTTISHWDAREWIEETPGNYYCNNKRAGFLPFLDLPSQVSAPMELALCLCSEDEADRKMLLEKQWRIVHSYDVSSTPEQYQSYIQRSLGEFACCKPSCVKLQNGWVSDRSLCYLASGKPVVVEHSGPNPLLPEAAGMFRFKNMTQAVRSIDKIMSDYPNQSKLAHALAAEHFDSRKVAKALLERALESTTLSSAKH